MMQLLELNSSNDKYVSHFHGSDEYDNIGRYFNVSYEYDNNNGSDFNGSYESNNSFARFINNLETYSYVVTITSLVLSLSGMILNISLIIVLLSVKGSLKTHLKFILSLSISDFMIGVNDLATDVYVCLTRWKVVTTEPPIVVQIITVIYVFAQYARLGTMLAISVDILIKIRKPLKYKLLMSKRRGNMIVICLWLVLPVIFFLLSWLLFFPNLPLPDAIRTVIGAVCLYVFLFIIFLIVFVVIYAIIFFSIRNFTNRAPSRRPRSLIKAGVTFFVIIVIYFVCLSPYLWLYFGIFVFQLSYSILLTQAVYCLYIVSTICEPIIYIFRVPELKEKYRLLYGKLCSSMCR